MTETDVQTRLEALVVECEFVSEAGLKAAAEAALENGHSEADVAELVRAGRLSNLKAIENALQNLVRRVRAAA